MTHEADAAHPTPTNTAGYQSVKNELKSEDEQAEIFLQELIAEGCWGDSGAPLDSRPQWIDEKKMLLGQQFAQKYFLGVMFADLVAFLVVFSVSDSVQPLIFSGSSDTPLKAFRRYLSFTKRMRTWYSGDLWAEDDAAHKSLRAVRRLHNIYRRRIRDAKPEERMRRTTLTPPLLLSGIADATRADFCGASLATGCPIFGANSPRWEWINQLEMAVTQFGFVGLVVMFPERFGVGGASEEELEGFVHLWRVLGHLLGIEKRFNFCAGGLEAVRARSRCLMRSYMVPALAEVDAVWEHISRCFVKGVGFYVPVISYKVSLMYLLETLGVAAPRLQASLSVVERCNLRVMTLLLCWGLRVPPLRALFNWIFHKLIERAEKSPMWLRAQENYSCDL